jgi:DNA polymerase V
VPTRSEEQSPLASLPVSDLGGIGKRRAARLAECGIGTRLEFAQAGRRPIRRLLAVVGEAIWCEANGEPVLPPKSGRPRHEMLGRGGGLGREPSDPRMIPGWMVRNRGRLVEEFRLHRAKAGRISLRLCYRQG